MTIRLCVTLSILFFLGESLGFSQTCPDDRTNYLARSEPLLIKTNEDAKRLSPETMERLTEETHAFIQKMILRELNEGKTAPETESSVNCIQEGSAVAQWKDESNLPIVRRYKDMLIAAYWIPRGGEAVPSFRTFVDLYTKKDDNWVFRESVGDDFTGYTLTVKIMPDVAHAYHLVIYGSRIGDPQTPFKIEVFKMSSHGFVKAYESSPLSRARLISLSPEKLVVSQMIQADGHYRDRQITITLGDSPIKEK